MSTDTSIKVRSLNWLQRDRAMDLLSPGAEQKHFGAGSLESEAEQRQGDYKEAEGMCGLPVPSTDYAWTADDLRQVQRVDYLFAADCIYDDHLTDAFFATVKHIFAIAPSLRRLFLTIEKRVNFSVHDLAARAHAYDYFRSHFNEEEAYGDGVAGADDTNGSQTSGDDNNGGPMQAPSYNLVESADQIQHKTISLSEARLVGRKIETASVPQVFEYDRVSELELWEIWAPSASSGSGEHLIHL
mmetsp:Transcript_12390/g.26063  ORF Transcript_12390/g.26063 Transcript_12390/m.26063 type:complete len:243 (-) Transcript_12390:1-729(-)